MRKFLLIAGAAAALLSVAAPASAAICVRQNDIWNWSSVDDKTLIFENGRHEKVLAHLAGTCGDFKFHDSIRFQSRGGMGLDCVRQGDQVITRNTGIRGVCFITSVEPYAPGKPAVQHSSYSFEPTPKPAN